MHRVGCDHTRSRAVELQVRILDVLQRREMKPDVALAVPIKSHGLRRIVNARGVQVTGRVRLGLDDHCRRNIRRHGEVSFRNSVRHGGILGCGRRG
jgi:hypothetical protein